MSNAGSARGHGDSHRRRDYQRATKNEAPPDAVVSVFQSQRTPMVGSSRRHRGYQPDEVNKKPPKIELGASSNTQIGEIDSTSPVVIENHPNASATDNKLASTMTSRSTKPLPPHRKTHVNRRKSNHHPFAHTQVSTMDASGLEPDLMHFDGVSETIDTEVSSIQIMTDRKPSCWSIASPPEAPPTEWNSAAANIDRPATTKLPIYRFKKPEHSANRDIVSSPSNPEAKRKSQAAETTLTPQKPYRVNGSQQLATESNDGNEATARVTFQEAGSTANSLHHQFQELQHDERLDAEQASQIRAIQDEVLSRTIQVSPNVQLECDQSKLSSPAQNVTQAKILDDNASSAVPSQTKNKQLYVPPEKRNRAILPHLRVPAARQGTEKKAKSLLETSASLSTTAAREEDLKRERHATSAMQVDKLPPHRQVLSAANDQANKGPASVIVPSPTPLKNDDNYRPPTDREQGIAKTKSVLDIDEEIAAALRAESSNPYLGAQSTDGNAGGTKERAVYISPHPELKSKFNDDQPKLQFDQHGTGEHSINTRSNEVAAESYADTPQNVISERKNAKSTSPWEGGAVPNGAESSIRKGEKPAKEVAPLNSPSGLLGWDGKMNQPPVGDEWDRRQPFNPQRHERLCVIEAWRDDQAADPDENNRLIVDTASADFQTGEGLVGGDVNVLSPIDKRDHETLASNDDFTQARRHQSAADAIKDYGAKIAAKPKSAPSGIEGMTRDEKRRLRRALIEEARARRALPNPYAPAANIYLRPAEFKDMGQVTTIYNYYVRETSFVLHLDNVDELYWRSRLQEAEDERNPFIVAIHMGEKSCRYQEDIIRKKQENVVGFAVAADFGNKLTVYHNSVELELMIHPEFYNQGTGRTLLDRILAALTPDHNLLECAPFLPQNDISHWISGGSRQAKAVIVNIHYSDGEEDTVAWRKQWLAKYEFNHVGTLPHVGFKKGKLVNTCLLVLNTSARA